MIKAQKKAARLLAQRKTAKHKVQPYDTTGAGNRQAHIYAPAPGEIAYVAYHENKQRGWWEITISPRRCSKWGIFTPDMDQGCPCAPGDEDGGQPWSR